MRVRDVMTAEVVTVTPGTSLKAAAEAMIRHGVSGLPVVDEADRLVGIVTEADFLDREAERDWSRPFRLLEPLFGRGREALAQAEYVADVMTTDLVTVTGDVWLGAAARTMAEGSIKRLPVVDDRGRLVGILSRTDIMRAFARSDDAVLDDIQALLAHHVILVEADSLEVGVESGVVALAGTVETRSDALALADVIQRIEGVVRVDTHLKWNVDDRVAEDRWPGFSREGGAR